MGNPEAYEGEEQGGSKMWIWILVAVLVGFCLVGIAVVGIMATLTMPALMKAKQKANQTKCASNLRQLGLGALQYGDDKRFLPHVGSIQELDGGAETSDGPHAIRALINGGYFDSAEVLVCPESFDVFVPPPPGAQPNPGEWFWGGDTRPNGRISTSSITDGMQDPTLMECDELSYGWTRRGLNNNVRSTQPLAADRGLRTGDDLAVGEPGEFGNHEEGLNVVHAEASTQWLSTTADPNAFDALLDDADRAPALGLVPRQQ